MPGIAGLVTRMPRAEAERQLVGMVAALRLDADYSVGTWIDEALGVYVGWAVRGRSFSDSMPISDPKGGVVLIFHGEEFPKPALVPPTGCGETRPGNARGSYLLRLYQEDRAFPAGLNGRFQGVLADRNRGTAILFNDRYGMQRVYYHESDDALYFSADAKAILAVRPELRRLDPRGLGELIACGCVLEERTIFNGINVLPPGSAWLCRRGCLDSRAKYFDPREWEEQQILEPEPYYTAVRNVFAQNLPRYFAGTERIGLSLTGGLDTRMILGWWRPAPQSLPSYTFGGMIRDSRDVQIARQVAKAAKQPHEVISVGEEFLSSFSGYAGRTVYLSDGCADVSRAPDLYVNERARWIAPVRMTGNYGDEVLRRVRSFRPASVRRDLFTPELASHVDRARETYQQSVEGHPLSFAVFRQAPWHHYGLLALEQTQVSVRTPYLDNDLVRTVFQAPEESVTSNVVSRRLIADGSPEMADIATDRGLAIGRATVASIVAHRVHELTFKAEYAFDYGMPQWVVPIDRRLRRLKLDRAFLGRHKFCHFRSWYRHQLSPFVRDTLLGRSAAVRSYVDPVALRSVVEGHVSGTANWTTELHKLLTLELIHRTLLNGRDV